MRTTPLSIGLVGCLFSGIVSATEPDTCMATYSLEAGTLHIPCVTVSGSEGETQVYEIDLQQMFPFFSFEADLGSIKPIPSAGLPRSRLAATTTCPSPVIEFSSVPPYGSFNDLKGRVKNVNTSDYKVAVYIFVSGWWTKPFWTSPLTSIQKDGSWVCDITTGGIDQKATKIAAFLVPSGYSPPAMSGGQTLPQEIYNKAVSRVEITRKP